MSDNPKPSYEAAYVIPVLFTRTVSFNGGLLSRTGPSIDGFPLGANFENVNVLWLRSQIAKLLDADYAVNKMYYDGDHWQRGDAWTGPRPAEGDKDAQQILANIEKAFVSKNCILEVSDRASNGVIGREPVWNFASRTPPVVEPEPVPPAPPTAPVQPPQTAQPPANSPASNGNTPPNQPAQPPAEPVQRVKPVSPEEREIGEIEHLLTEWWDSKRIHKILRRVVVTALLGKRATLRIFIPDGVRQGDGTIRIEDNDLASALRYIFVDTPEYDDAGVITDTRTMRELGVYLFKDGETQRAEICYVNSPAPDADTALVDDEGQGPLTTIRIVTGEGQTVTTVVGGETVVEGQEVFVDDMQVQLNGNLTIFELELPKLITNQVRQMQRSINKALTMGDHNLDLAGFLERTALNAQLPGHYEDVPAANGRAAYKKFVRDPMNIGGGSVNFMVGYPIYDNAGNVSGYTSPSMVYKDPVTPTTFDESYMLMYRALLQETHQLHYLLAGEQYASGESRKQARADFEDALRGYRSAVNEMGRWLLETVLAYGEWLAGIEGEYSTRYRAVFNARLNPGPATSETVTSAINLYENDGLSQEGLMEWSGVDDIDAERERIKRNRAEGFGPNKSVGPPNIGMNRGPGRPEGALTGQNNNPPAQN